MNDNSIKELIDSFVAYRELLAPLAGSLRDISDAFEEVRRDLDTLVKNFSGDAAGRLDKVHAAVSAQAKSGQELGRRIEEYAASGERYAQAVSDMSTRFSHAAESLDALAEIERTAREKLERIDALLVEKKASYNFKELQKSLDGYNANVERISEFINKDVASVLKQNAERTEELRRENEELAAAVKAQGRDIAALAAEFSGTSALIKQLVEGSTVNEKYLFDAFDKWAADRKVKTKKQ